jgi:hypothetical protein
LSVLVLAAMAVAAPLARADSGAGTPPCPPGAAPKPQGLACVLLDKTATGAAALTSAPAEQDPWLTEALELQHRLGDSLPWRDAMWVGTHNSFNTVANVPPSPSNLDSNQHVSLVQQLDLGIRSLEIDIHWILDRVVVCHGRPESELDAGCTYERTLADELAPIAAWVAAHPGDVVLLYVEDDVASGAAYASAASTIGDVFGSLLYRPPGGGCPLLPLDLSRDGVLASGAQVVVMSGCGAGAGDVGAWGATVFDDAVRAEEGNPDFRDCTSPSVPRTAYGTKLVRFYEDSTFVSAAVAGGDPGHRFTVDTVTAMVACGVNLFGLDQVDPNDARLSAMVWSWAPGEPVSSEAGTCAVDGPDRRFHAMGCDGAAGLPFACVDAAGGWFVGDGGCGTGTFAVPRNGAQAAALRAAEAAAGVGSVQLAYAVVNGAWRASQ